MLKTDRRNIGIWQYVGVPRGDLSPLRNLHVDPVGILDVETGIVALQGHSATLREIARRGGRVEARDADREVVDRASRTSEVDRHQYLAVAEANDVRICPADHGKSEHLLIEVYGALKVRDLA